MVLNLTGANLSLLKLPITDFYLHPDAVEAQVAEKNTPLAESGLNVLWTTYVVRKMITFQEPNQRAAY